MHLVPLRLAFLGIAVLSALGNLFVPFLLTTFQFSFNPEWDFGTVFVGVLNGFLIGEFVAIAFWILFDPMSLPIKILLGALIGLFLSGCLVLGVQVWPGMPLAAGVFILIVGSVFPLVFVCLLVGVRRLTLPKNGTILGAEPQGKSRQYGIGFLLGVMIAVALAITIIRSVVPSSSGGGWLSYWEFVFLSLWFVWLSIGVTLFIWFPFVSVLKTSWFNISIALVLAVFGPSLFDWTSGFILMWIGRMNPGANYKIFSVLPQCISFGLLATSLLLGAIIRLCLCKEPAVDIAIDSAHQA